MSKLKWEDVDSSNVQQVAFDEQTKTLAVRFHGGGLYSYDDVDMTIYTSLKHAPSVGRYFNNVVKGSYVHNKWPSETELEQYVTRA